jgi:hypothetical protein
MHYLPSANGLVGSVELIEINMPEPEKKDDYAMHAIVGQQLSAVTFARNYLELSFNSDMISVLLDPSVIVGGSVYLPGDSGYRDRLCERITHIVIGAKVLQGDAVKIVFDDDSAIVLPDIDDGKVYGPGRIFYQPSDAYEDWWEL